MRRIAFPALASAAVLAACTAAPRAPARIDARCTGAPGRPRVLVYTAENLWNHPSNPVAAQALQAMCTARGISVTVSADPAAFADELPATDVVVFAVTSGPVMTREARDAFEPWVRSGGGVVGLHSASATEPDWPFFGALMAGQFRGHGPGLYDARLVVEDLGHPITTGLAGAMLMRADEWYSFIEHPEDVGAHILMSLDEASLPGDYPPDLLMGHHAITWTHERLGGRVFYTALGHAPDVFAAPWFLDLIGRAIDWTAKRDAG